MLWHTMPTDKPLRVLSIDPGQTNVAVCMLDENYGSVVTTKIDIPDGITTSMCKFIYLEQVIAQWIQSYQPDIIVKEAPALGATFGVADAGKFQFLVETLAFSFNIPVITVQTTSMLKFIGATGQKSKGLTRLCVFKKFGKEFTTEDETDAYAIGQTGLAIICGQYDVTKKARKKK